MTGSVAGSRPTASHARRAIAMTSAASAAFVIGVLTLIRSAWRAATCAVRSPTPAARTGIAPARGPRGLDHRPFDR